MKKTIFLRYCLPLWLALLPVPAAAAKLALVIGNDRYRHVSELQTAGADARAISLALEQAGYQVDFWRDVDEKTLKAALRDFKKKVAGGDEAVFFYSGHGVQLGAVNYLLPVDITGDNEAQIRDEAIPLQRILDDLQEQKAKFTLALIDACRDNPFKGSGRYLAGRGLAPTTAATGQMVIYSAGSGQQALDRLNENDHNPNGVFTRVFLEEMKQPGVPVDRVLKNVRQKVVDLAKSVQHEQVPALYDQVVGEFYFYPPPGGVPLGVAPPSLLSQETPPRMAVAPAAPPGNTSLPPISPEKRRALDVLELIVEDIAKVQAGKEREQLQRELLDKSGKFAAQYPDELEIWRMRAAIAMELELAEEGWEAGKRLRELGVEERGDGETRKLMARLERKGWLGPVSPRERRAAESAVEEMRRQQEEWQRRELAKAENEQLQQGQRQQLETAQAGEEEKAAAALRQEALTLLGQGGPEQTPEARAESLLAAHRIFERILATYPRTAGVAEIRERLRILDEQLSQRVLAPTPGHGQTVPEQ